MSQGLIIAGRIVEVPGVLIANHTTDAWAHLDRRDYMPRNEPWVRQLIMHTTKGIWPQVIMPGAGKPGRDQWVAEYWNGDPKQSAAHIVVDNDGSAACLADLATIAAFHATSCNRFSIGIEVYQEAGGRIYQAAIDAAVRIANVITRQFLIPRQIPHAYLGGPLARFANGGRDLVGVFGHRDQTANRGSGDPGDYIMAALETAGYQRLNFAINEDREVWKARQRINGLEADGIPGPRTMRVMYDLGDPRYAF